MKTVGLLISHKNHETRRALLPQDASKLEHPQQYYVEENYGESVGIKDSAYLEKGLHVVPRQAVLEKDILVDVKLGDADFFKDIAPGRILFGWAHAVQGIEFTNHMMKGAHTVYAWEELYEGGRFILYRNQEIAGESAVLHALSLGGHLPYEAKAAIIGNGNVARGAMRVLHGLGATVDVFGRRLDRLFRKKMFDYDIIINAVFWDTARTDRLIYKRDLKKMKKGAMIIDISCDIEMEIETSRPTTFDDPVYMVDGVMHYCVDNTPSMFGKSVSRLLSDAMVPLYNELVRDEPGKMMQKARVIAEGRLVQQRIIDFRTKRNLPI